MALFSMEKAHKCSNTHTRTQRNSQSKCSKPRKDDNDEKNRDTKDTMPFNMKFHLNFVKVSASTSVKMLIKLPTTSTTNT